jgi:hypothetical protein
MAECFITSLEDVLAIDHNSAWSRHVQVFQSLGTTFRSVILTAWERDEAKRWLRTERVTYGLLLDKGASILDNRSWKLSQVKEIMGMGWPIGLYLDADPQAVQEVLALGITTLLVSFRVRRPNWLPSHSPPRAWDDLVAFVDEQREADGSVGDRGVNEVGGGGRDVGPLDVRHTYRP